MLLKLTMDLPPSTEGMEGTWGVARMIVAFGTIILGIIYVLYT